METLYVVGMPVGLAILGLVVIFIFFADLIHNAKVKEDLALSKRSSVVGSIGTVSLGIFLLLSAAEIAFGDYKFFGYTPQGYRFVLESAQWYVSRYLLLICAIVLVLTQVINLVAFISKKIKA